jgi:hypothetical protein
MINKLICIFHGHNYRCIRHKIIIDATAIDPIHTCIVRCDRCFSFELMPHYGENCGRKDE